MQEILKMVTTDRDKQLLKFVATAVTGYSRRGTSKFSWNKFRKKQFKSKKGDVSSPRN